MPLSPGTRLGPFEVAAPLGAGGMGEVYRARDTRLGRDVAIKVLPAAFAADADRVRRFEQEAQSIAALNPPNICQLHDIGPGYLVLEYVEGEVRRGPMAVEEALRFARQISSALDAAHGRGILHRDLKPANIIVSHGSAATESTAKLLDFGIAKLMDVPAGGGDAATRTVAGAVIGTAAYMSPEQAEGKPLDARSDVFSFGAVLYELLSGRRAFDGESTAQVVSAVLRDDPPALDAPPAIDRIVRRCLAKRSLDRFQTMRELRAALDELRATKAVERASIVVLPFENMSGDKENEYFSDGLAEEIINALTRIPGLKVIARTSAFAFKSKPEDVRRIAEALGVTKVLEGSVRKAGNRIRVMAQLIDAADGTHVWSERYDRELDDVFAVQDEIAAAITAALRGTFSASAPLQRCHTPNLLAYDHYLKALHLCDSTTPQTHGASAGALRARDRTRSTVRARARRICAPLSSSGRLRSHGTARRDSTDAYPYAACARDRPIPARGARHARNSVHVRLRLDRGRAALHVRDGRRLCALPRPSLLRPLLSVADRPRVTRRQALSIRTERGSIELPVSK